MVKYLEIFGEAWPDLAGRAVFVFMGRFIAFQPSLESGELGRFFSQQMPKLLNAIQTIRHLKVDEGWLRETKVFVNDMFGSDEKSFDLLKLFPVVVEKSLEKRLITKDDAVDDALKVAEDLIRRRERIATGR